MWVDIVVESLLISAKSRLEWMKVGGCELVLVKSRLEWVRVGGSEWEWLELDGSGSEWFGVDKSGREWFKVGGNEWDEVEGKRVRVGGS